MPEAGGTDGIPTAVGFADSAGEQVVADFDDRGGHQTADADVETVGQRTVPASLTDRGLTALWDALRQRLDRGVGVMPATMQMPVIEPRCEPAVAALIGRSPTSRLNVAELEAGLVRLGIGHDLDSALTLLGSPADPAKRKKRESTERARQARRALERAVESWPEAWASDWRQDLLGSGLLNGLDTGEVAVLAGSVRRLLDAQADLRTQAISRTELAAQLFGSAHALDRHTKLAAAVERALRYAVGLDDSTAESRAVWSAAGIAADSVSAPALTLGLRPLGASPLTSMLGAAADAGLPVHVSLRALREHRVGVVPGTPMLVVENPSVVERAADVSAAFGLVCTNGNPTSAVTELVSQLAAGGADLRYHGDFDAAGIAICRRMRDRGCTPWMMSAADYFRAVQRATAQGVSLPSDSATAGPTPWDPALEAEFDSRRRIVHEEFVAAEFLHEFGSYAAAQRRR